MFSQEMIEAFEVMEEIDIDEEYGDYVADNNYIATVIELTGKYGKEAEIEHCYFSTGVDHELAHALGNYYICKI